MQKKYPKTEYKRYFCVPACLKSILSHRNMDKNITLWTIGRGLDLRVPKSLSNEYPNTTISENDIFEINLHKKENSINTFFKKHSLPLKENYIFRIGKKSIINLLKKFQNSDILICFDYPTIANISDKKWGHVSLISKFNGKNVFIQDPQSVENIEISYEILSKAIQKHGKKRRGGFWIISETKCALPSPTKKV